MARTFSGFFVFIALLTCNALVAQDTLPKFSVVTTAANRNVISWTNNYPYTSQINIQRSDDSVKSYKSILTVPDPSVPQNGFVDTKAPAGVVFYRLFIVQDSGKWHFTKPMKPTPDTGKVANEPVLNDNQRVVLSDSMSTSEVASLKEKLESSEPTAPRPGKFFTVKRNNEFSSLSERDYKNFKDSIVYQTKDTLVFEAVDTIVIMPFTPKEIYRASRHVFTEKYGNVMITLPEAGKKKYSINFFEEDRSPLFEIKEVHSTSLIIDKTNFVHSGWFWFELFENGILLEKHKFYLPKDF